MNLNNVKNIKLRGQNVLSVKYNGQVIWRKQAESSPLTILAEIYLTNSSYRLFGDNTKYNTLERIEHVYIDDIEVPIQETYSRSTIGSETAGKHNLKVVLKKQDVYDLSYLFYTHHYALITGLDSGTYKGFEILPNINGEKYKVSNLRYAFSTAATSANVYFSEIKGLENFDVNECTDFYGCFRHTLTNKIDISSWDIDVTCTYFFATGATYNPHLETVYIGNFNRDQNTVFTNQKKLTNLEIKSFTQNWNAGTNPLSKESVWNVVNAAKGTGKYTITFSDISRGCFTDEEWEELLSKVPSNYTVVVQENTASASLLNDDFGMPNDYKYISDEI